MYLIDRIPYRFRKEFSLLVFFLIRKFIICRNRKYFNSYQENELEQKKKKNSQVDKGLRFNKISIFETPTKSEKANSLFMVWLKWDIYTNSKMEWGNDSIPETQRGTKSRNNSHLFWKSLAARKGHFSALTCALGDCFILYQGIKLRSWGCENVTFTKFYFDKHLSLSFYGRLIRKINIVQQSAGQWLCSCSEKWISSQMFCCPKASGKNKNNNKFFSLRISLGKKVSFIWKVPR